jgi:hypothetical protein
MTHAEDALRAELEERLRFEALLADLSARFVHVPAVKALVPGGVDVVFDCFGADALAKAFDCVKPGGRTVFILVREATGQAAKAGVHHHYVFVEPNVPELDHIRSLVEAGGGSRSICPPPSPWPRPPEPTRRWRRATRAGRSSSRCSAWRGPSVEA